MSDSFLENLERQGVEAVRRDLASGFYGVKGNVRQMVVDWLAMKDQTQTDLSQSLQAQAASRAVAAAERAAEAAERQATTAERATRTAIAALIVAIIAAIASIVALFRSA